MMRRIGRRRRALRPGLERVEGRQLLSGLIAALAPPTPRPSLLSLLARQVSTVHAEQGGAGGGSGGGGSGGGGGSSAGSGGSGSGGLIAGLGNGFGPSNDSSPLLGSGTPTPHELARETFRASFTGRYYTSPGRFSDQGQTYFFRGIGGSTDFLHGDFNMGIVTPTTPTSPFVGEAYLQDKNNNSSAALGLILRGDRTRVDALGRPTHLEFVADPNIYSGPYYVDAAEGTVDITYGPGPDHPIKAVFNGRVYTSGLTNPLTNQDLYARHARPLRYRGPAARPSP